MLSQLLQGEQCQNTLDPWKIMEERGENHMLKMLIAGLFIIGGRSL